MTVFPSGERDGPTFGPSRSLAKLSRKWAERHPDHLSQGALELAGFAAHESSRFGRVSRNFTGRQIRRGSRSWAISDDDGTQGETEAGGRYDGARRGLRAGAQPGAMGRRPASGPSPERPRPINRARLDQQWREVEAL